MTLTAAPMAANARVEVLYEQAATVRRYSALVRGRYSRTANHMRGARRGDHADHGKVCDALKVTEDVHAARVFTSALELFRIRSWTGYIQHKLALIRDTDAALYDEALATRAEWLEAAIVPLLLFEILYAP